MSEKRERIVESAAEVAVHEQVGRIKRELARLLSDPRVSLQDKEDLRSDPLLRSLLVGGAHDS